MDNFRNWLNKLWYFKYEICLIIDNNVLFYRNNIEGFRRYLDKWNKLILY